jgi:signal transduction histidine kinase/signal recognition particle receptor subunit beta
MVQFDNQYRQVKLKVVYYGPCLQYIHRVTDPQRRTKLYTLNTASDRTLFFDLLALDLGRIRGYRLMLQLYTVPGQVQYNATRRAVLAGCDGVVFVADSQPALAKANEESLANLGENLHANGLDPDTIPLVLKYNKRDLPGVLSRVQLDEALNRRSLPVFETIATTGVGVLEGFAAITEATVLSVADRLGLANQTDALNRLVTNVRTALQPLMRRGVAPDVEPPIAIRPASARETLSESDLVAEAVRANVAMTDLNARLDHLTSALERRIADLRTINDFGRVMTAAREPEEITAPFLDRLLAELKVACGALLLVDERGELVEVVRRGIAADPLVRRHPDGGSGAETILASRQPFSARLDDVEPSQLLVSPWMEEVRGLSLDAVLAVPLIAQDRTIGLATAYGDGTHGGFEEGDLELANALAANAAVALANARAWRSLEQLNRSLDQTVRDRTHELEQALEQVQKLAGELDKRNVELEAANRKLVDLERLKGDLLNRIAHELNTPVAAIQTAARILTRHDEIASDKRVKFAEIIAQESGRLAELIASAFQAIVLGAADARPAPTAVPLSDLLRRVLAPLKGEISARKLAVQVKVASGLDHLTGDADQLETALRAVVKNAVEFNRDGGDLVVIVRPVRDRDRGMVEIRVEDSGSGIRSEDLPHVGEVFWQGGEPAAGKPRGLGLGLAVARRVVEGHGGTLEITSTPGNGTAVSLRLPATEVLTA